MFLGLCLCFDILTLRGWAVVLDERCSMMSWFSVKDVISQTDVEVDGDNHYQQAGCWQLFAVWRIFIRIQNDLSVAVVCAAITDFRKLLPWCLENSIEKVFIAQKNIEDSKGSTQN